MIRCVDQAGLFIFKQSAKHQVGVINITIIIMTESEEVLQRRREKILSRAASATTEDDEEPISPISKTNVFDRYKLLKEREENEKRLIFISKISGLFVFLLSSVLGSSIAFCVNAFLLILSAYFITINTVESGKQFDWITKKVPLLGKLAHLDRFVLMGRIILNSLSSFILVTALINAGLKIYNDHFGAAVSATAMEL